MKKLSFALIIISLMLIFTGCVSGSVYSEVKKGDSYSITAKKLNTTLSAEYRLDAGDSIEVHMTVRSGEFHVTIASDSGTIYEGNGAGLAAFTVNIPSDGRYTISVSGKNAVGSLNFGVIR